MPLLFATCYTLSPWSRHWYVTYIRHMFTLMLMLRLSIFIHAIAIFATPYRCCRLLRLTPPPRWCRRRLHGLFIVVDTPLRHSLRLHFPRLRHTYIMICYADTRHVRYCRLPLLSATYYYRAIIYHLLRYLMMLATRHTLRHMMMASPAVYSCHCRHFSCLRCRYYDNITRLYVYFHYGYAFRFDAIIRYLRLISLRHVADYFICHLPFYFFAAASHWCCLGFTILIQLFYDTAHTQARC